MIKLIDFKDRPFDKVIQMALRDIDTENLADAMFAWNDEERGVILRNMSKRAAELLMNIVKENEGNVPDHSAKSASAFFMQKVQQYLRFYAQDDEAAQEYLFDSVKSRDSVVTPEVDLSNDEAVISTFVNISKFVRKNGLLALSGIEEIVDHPVLAKGLQLSIDGWDPMLKQTILERMCTEYLKKTRRRLDMIMVGLESLTAGDHPAGMVERLRAFLV